ncbi:MAG: ABC transporter ATP-binding protein/permease [Propionibacteriaceae bacterium]|jgi:ATP-binding cassette subfamily B protein|nr:ABC transporter ATP-binding protein/permease [Propionibacteriaceae bacterium]
MGNQNDPSSRHDRAFRRVLRLMAPQRGSILGAAGMSLLAAGFTLVQPLLVNGTLRRLQEGEGVGWLPLLLVITLACATTISVVESYLLLRASERLVLRARRAFIRSALRLPISYYDRNDLGDLVSRAVADTSQLRHLLTEGLVESVGSVAIIIGAATAMLVIDPLLFMIAAAVSLLTFTAMFLVSRTMRRTSQQIQSALGLVGSEMTRFLGAVKTIRASVAERKEERRVEKAAENAYLHGIRLAKAEASVAPLANATMQIAFLVVVAVGGMRVAQSRISIADLVTFLLFLFMLIGPVGSSYSTLGSVYRALGSVNRLDEIHALQPEEDRSSATAQIATTGGRSSIELIDVWFSYESRAPNPVSAPPDLEDGSWSISSELGALRGLSFRAHEGQVTAIVGPSGAGKSTVFNLIERFYDPQRGSIRVAEQDIGSVPREAVRDLIGYVEQDAPVLSGSFRDNLKLCSTGASDAACWEALAAVNLDSLVRSSPGQLSSRVGERGTLLSGGERQRLALARVMLSGRPIILLDESTSNLDSANEELLRRAIREASDDRTVIMIAHRLSTVIGADKIVVMEAGKAVAEGRHEELLNTSQLYRGLAEAQFGPTSRARRFEVIVT